MAGDAGRVEQVRSLFDRLELDFWTDEDSVENLDLCLDDYDELRRNSRARERPLGDEWPLPTSFKEHSRGLINRSSDIVGYDAGLEEANYGRKFHQLLWLEEAGTEDERSAYTIERIEMRYKVLPIEHRPRDGQAGTEARVEWKQLYVVDCDDMRADPMVKEGASVEVDDKFRGNIYEIDNRLVWFDINFFEKYRIHGTGKLVERRVYPEDTQVRKIKLTESRIPFVRCHQAVHRMRSSGWFAQYLFPRVSLDHLQWQCDKHDTRSIKEEFINKDLNRIQRRAVEMVRKARCRPHPFVLFGPPGTGKTTVLIECILQLYVYSQDKLLVCGNSNTCAEMLALMLLKANLIAPKQIIRIVAESRLNTWRGEAEQLREITCVIDRSSGDELQAARIIVCTCSQAAKMEESGLLMFECFDYVFVDEAGHALEPEALIPMQFMKPSGCMVLAGDPYQLEPVAKDSEARDNGLGKSLLKRLFELQPYQKRRLMGHEHNRIAYDETHIVKLLGCFRCDPRIMAPSNELFYENELVCTNKTPDSLLTLMNGAKSPLIFVESSSDARVNPGERSMFNSGEAKICKRVFDKLTNEASSSHLPFSDVAIITNYKKQKDVISGLFGDNRHHKKRVFTVDQFQGEQCKAVIISTVKTLQAGNQNNQFVFDAHRFNVAVSRAEWLTIVVGDSRLLKKSLEWAKYIDMAHKLSI